MTHSRFAATAVPAAALLALAGGCASMRYQRMAPPDDSSAFGLRFGADRAAAEGALRAQSIAVRPTPDDVDALVADRCPAAPVAAPCRLEFGPQGLYAAQIGVPPEEAASLASAVERGLGAPDRGADPSPPAEGIPSLVAGWHRPGWTVTVSRSAPHVSPATAMLRVEHDPVAPPVVAGVPLGRLREDVEAILERQGATLVQRDAGATTYLGCPQGGPDALSCVVLFRDGRAAAVTEIEPSAGDDRAALSAWRLLAKRFEKDIGRAPRASCPEAGPDRVAGDCTATWTSERLVVVVGAHRNAGSSHRGAISVYTAFSYPPLASTPPSDEEALEAE
jgi:hypothetical protein